MNLSQHAASTGLAAINALYNGATLTLYSGPIPTSPEAAIGTGNTALATFTFANPSFSTPAYSTYQMETQASFAATSVTPAAAGTACFARAVASSYATVLADYTVGMAWAASTPVVVGQYVANNGNTYVCVTAGTTASAGGPSGTGANIADGGAQWSWINAGSPDVVLSEVTLSTAAPVSLNAFAHQQGAL